MVGTSISRILKWPLIPRVSQAQLEIFPNEPIHWSFISKQNVIFRGKQFCEFGDGGFLTKPRGGQDKMSLSGAQVPGCWLKNQLAKKTKTPTSSCFYRVFHRPVKNTMCTNVCFQDRFHVGRFMSKKMINSMSPQLITYPFTSIHQQNRLSYFPYFQ